MYPAASDFLFCGAAILPPFLFFAGEPALAVLALVFLLLGAAVCAIGASVGVPPTRK